MSFRSIVFFLVAIFVSLVSLVSLASLASLGSCAEPQQPSLDVTPGGRTLTTGDTVQLTVTRRFAGGAVDDVTHAVQYTTSDKGVAVVDVRGVVTAGANAGSALIRVYDPTSNATGVTTFTIVEPKVLSIDVEPSVIALTVGGAPAQLTATETFTNDATREATTQVVWSSINEAVATVDPSGMVKAVSPGETDVVAKDAESGVTGRATIFVQGAAPALVAIVVSPNPGIVAVGTTLQLTALGVFSDGTSHDLTRDVAWSSSVTGVATVDASGVATGVAAGTTTFTATGPEPSSGVKGSAAATITP